MVLGKVKSKFQVLFYEGSGKALKLRQDAKENLRLCDSKYKKLEIKLRFLKKLMF